MATQVYIKPDGNGINLTRGGETAHVDLSPSTIVRRKANGFAADYAGWFPDKRGVTLTVPDLSANPQTPVELPSPGDGYVVMTGRIINDAPASIFLGDNYLATGLLGYRKNGDLHCYCPVSKGRTFFCHYWNVNVWRFFYILCKGTD